MQLGIPVTHSFAVFKGTVLVFFNVFFPSYKHSAELSFLGFKSVLCTHIKTLRPQDLCCC